MFLEQFHGVRDNPDFVLSLNKVEGILTFPSVHAAVGVLCIWGAWRIPFIRYPFLLINVAMCVSAITHASHYFVDILAGCLVAVACIVLVKASKGIFARSTPKDAIKGQVP